ncbi:Flp family type IVb pilin [Sphingomonas sp. CGMCC 1.13654]|uniref:Flp family type IVb pilin n=1 Tax=Sphingomonas chungangi TaxID=2683589 RepID=A0A838L469_9SPHN|nr:Flp family type IVb pilin [Sphingomonas chungangi]MBA2933219.1 Flp family type IVb pilin [Sphingomonas chungangi]
MRKIRELARDQKGGTLIEYGLILALIFVVMMVAVHALAIQVVGTINHVKNEVVNASAV